MNIVYIYISSLKSVVEKIYCIIFNSIAYSILADFRAINCTCSAFADFLCIYIYNCINLSKIYAITVYTYSILMYSRKYFLTIAGIQMRDT